MKFVWSTALLVAALLIAIGSLGGCAPLQETTSLGASRGSLADSVSGRGVHGELPALPGTSRTEPPLREAWGETRVTRLPGGSRPGPDGSILVARGDAGAVEPGRPTRALIASELAARFPDVTMRIVTDPLYNTYGPFGLAVGRDSAGSTCLYAWQWIQDHPRLRLAGGEAASVRIALCLPERTPAELAGLVRQLVLKFDGAPSRQGTRPPVATRSIGARAAADVRPSAPAAAVGEGKVYLAPLPGVATSRAEPSTSPGANPVPAIPAGPIVPLPQAE